MAGRDGKRCKSRHLRPFFLVRHRAEEGDIHAPSRFVIKHYVTQWTDTSLTRRREQRLLELILQHSDLYPQGMRKWQPSVESTLEILQSR